MNIIISHVYSADNKGDAAILGVLVQEIKNTFENVDITILTMDRTDEHETFDNVPVRPSFMYYVNEHSANKVYWPIYGLWLMLATMLWAKAWRKFKIKLPISPQLKQLLELYDDADLVIPVGGGYLRTNKNIGSIFDLTMLLHPLVVARLLGKPTVLYSQSVGPFYRKIETQMFKRTVKRDVDLAIIRENKSMQFLNSIGVTNAVRSVDAGFLLEKDSGRQATVKLPRSNGKIILGVTARSWLNETAQTEYERAMASTLDYMVRKHSLQVVFIPQVTSEFHDDDDRHVSQTIFTQMEEKASATVLTENYDYRQIKDIYDQLDFLLGTRFHSVIFSLTSHVPALAIEYEHKTSGIMHDLKLDEWVVKIEDVTPELLEPKLDKLILSSIAYKNHLDQVLPAYILQAHAAITFVEQAYEASLET